MFTLQLHTTRTSFNRKDPIAWVQDRPGLFPTLFTFVSFVVFGPSVQIGVQLALDPSAQYWVGNVAWTILLVPVLLILSHALHLPHGRPRFLPVLLGTCFPALIIAVIGYTHAAVLTYASSGLLSPDCTTYEQKFHLESAHKIARSLLDACAQRVANGTGMPLHMVNEQISLDDCFEYHDYHQPAGQHVKLGMWQKEWHYLRSLEERQFCTGFCHPGRALWHVSNTGVGICSNAAGNVIKAGAQGWSVCLGTLGIVDFAVSGITLFLIQEVLNRMHQEW